MHQTPKLKPICVPIKWSSSVEYCIDATAYIINTKTLLRIETRCCEKWSIAQIWDLLTKKSSRIDFYWIIYGKRTSDLVTTVWMICIVIFGTFDVTVHYLAWWKDIFSGIGEDLGFLGVSRDRFLRRYLENVSYFSMIQPPTSLHFQEFVLGKAIGPNRQDCSQWFNHLFKHLMRSYIWPMELFCTASASILSSLEILYTDKVCSHLIDVLDFISRGTGDISQN